MFKKKNSVVLKEKFYSLFKSSLKYAFGSKNYILFVSFLFLIFISLGYAFPKLFETQLLQMIKELIKQTEGLGFFGIIRFIVFNNVKSSFFGLFFGLIFGFFPIALIAVNGFLLGFVANKSVASEGVLVLWKLFPHGIFEIPAVLLSVGVGLRQGLFLFSIKDVKKGTLSFLLSFICFFLILSFVSGIFSLFNLINPANLNNSSLFQNPLFIFSYFVFMFLIFLISSYLSLYIFDRKKRKIIIFDFFSNLKNAFFVFIFLVIPLLVIAGIIEGSLIYFLK